MPRASIDPRLCDPSLCADGRCAVRAACPTKAILQMEHYEMPATLSDRCHGCSKCVADCPQRAVGMS
jgi:Fe-S-cluster-containing hydrogenase component 2